MTNKMIAKATIIKSALKYLVKMQIEEGSVGFAVDNDHDHDCCWDDVLAWIEGQPTILTAEEKEIIDAIHKMGLFRTNYANDKVSKAVSKIIKAYEAQQTDADCISRDSLNDAISELTYWHFEDGRLVVGGGGIKSETVYKVDDVVRMPDILPPVTPQASKEDIHREREQAYMLGYEDASKKFRTEPCEDCISREEVKNRIRQKFKDLPIRCEINEIINGLPSVTPQSYKVESEDKE